MKPVEGRAWVFGDNVNTDVMAPGLYFKSPIEEMARHCLEAIDPEFAPGVKAGDIVVGGRNFGVGSAREQAAMAFRHLGVGAILAKSFGRIFYRNALNFGVPALFFAEADQISAGDRVEVDAVTGCVANRSTGKTYHVAGLPAHLTGMIEAGGLMPYLKQQLGTGVGKP